jgi:DNA replication protein DnaC
LKQLLQLEFERRHQARIDRLQKQAQIPRNKLLREFEVSHIAGLSRSVLNRLAEGEFIDRCENILIFGNPGAGKTHLGIALSREWCLRGRKVLYKTAAKLVQELIVAKQGLALNDLIKKLDRFEILVIDDISYCPYDRQETDALFILLSERYEQRSVVVTSNLVFSQWNQIFKDEMTTAAAIDRLVHHATILELNVLESYRVAQAKARKAPASQNNQGFPKEVTMQET